MFHECSDISVVIFVYLRNGGYTKVMPVFKVILFNPRCLKLNLAFMSLPYYVLVLDCRIFVSVSNVCRINSATFTIVKVEQCPVLV